MLQLSPSHPAQAGGGAVTHVNSAHFHKQPAPTPPSLLHCSNIGNTGTRTQDILTSCHEDTCHQCHQLHRSALHAHSISASTVSTVRCVYLLAGVRVCSTHCLELVVVMLLVFTVMPRESSGHELPARWLEQHCQPAQPSPHCRPACCLAAWAVPPRAIQRSVQCTPYTTMQ